MSADAPNPYLNVSGNIFSSSNGFADWTAMTSIMSGDVNVNVTSPYNDTTLPWQPTPLTGVKGAAIGLVMLAAAFGNLLVIVSILRTPVSVSSPTPSSCRSLSLTSSSPASSCPSTLVKNLMVSLID
jgi:hypothetical protein